MNEYVDYGRVKNIFESVENDGNTFIKNLSVKLHMKHSKKMIREKPR